MEIIHHRDTTHVLGAPTAWDHDAVPCAGLPVILVPTDNGTAFVSCWRPTPEELAEIALGGYVTLTVFAKNHPVVSLSTTPAVEDSHVVDA